MASTIRKSHRDPGYRRQKKSNGKVVAFVELEPGKRIYLGPYDSPQSKRKYHQLLADWNANGRSVVSKQGVTTRIEELVVSFQRFADNYYRESNEAENFEAAIAVVKELYGDEQVDAFGPRALKACREAMVDKGWCRSSVNRMVGRVRRMFAWAVENELVEPNVLHALKAVAPLKRGRTVAPETDPVKPIPHEHVQAVMPFVSSQVASMIRLQLLTGSRPGEIVQLRPVDLDMRSVPWMFQPSIHKCKYRGHERVIYIGPQAQRIIEPFLGRPVDVFLFSPQEAEGERREAMHAARKTPLHHGNAPGTNVSAAPRRPKGDRYTTDSYRRAIHRACDRAEVPRWSPHRLRHNAATMLRKQFGIEAARLILGHRDPGITLIYAEADQEKAAAIMAEVG